MADVFVSYARTERAEAEAVKARLEALGLSVFLDVDGLDGGDVFSEKLDREVKTAGIVLGLWSPHALTRPWVQIECDIGKRRGVLVPAAIKPFRDMDVPAPFWNIQFVDLTEALHTESDPNWIKLQRSIARTLNRPDLAPKPPTTPRAPLTRPALAKPAGDLPDWARTQTGGSWEAPKQQQGSSAGLMITALVAVLLAGGAGAFWYFDPMHLGFRTADAPAPSDTGAALGNIVAVGPSPTATQTQPNPIVAGLLGQWRFASLTCKDAITISSSGNNLVIDYSGSLQTETIEGTEPDGSVRTRANGQSYFYTINGDTLTLRSWDGSSAPFVRCGK